MADDAFIFFWLPAEQSFFITTFNKVTLFKEVKFIFMKTSSSEDNSELQGKRRQNIWGVLGTTPWLEILSET